MFADAIIALNYVASEGWDGFTASIAEADDTWDETDRARILCHRDAYMDCLRDVGAKMILPGE